ncbi:dienelactone hydrolase family protein [Cohnella thermotolerans]|uniref:dienelactone hydrolase family protein n=1 Tax=Cohnella thermotolerans TaxID=329858 RepID=UPI0012EB6F5A|nr:dienelactone hydrolase family protein [Cohnella thermotolerans]
MRTNRPKARRIYAVGFSIGATVAWLCSGGAELDGAIGFYGSRIRSYMDVTPRCPTRLFFSRDERPYLTLETTDALGSKRGVSFEAVDAGHG